MKLTTTRLFLILFALSLGAVVLGLVLLKDHAPEGEGATGPRGPSDIIREQRRRAIEVRDKERRERALGFERSLHDGG
jgi:hypothetical protein